MEVSNGCYDDFGRLEQGKQQHTAGVSTILMEVSDQEGRRGDEKNVEEMAYGVLTEGL